VKSSTVRHGFDPFEIGRDSISPVSPDYKSPNAFTGKIEKVTFEVTEKQCARRGPGMIPAH
jgi:arylsulfatase